MITTFEEIPWHLSKHATPFIEMFQKLLQSLPYTSIDSSCTHKDMHLRGVVKLFAALDREKLPMPYNMMFIIGCIFRWTLTIILIIFFTQITYVLKRLIDTCDRHEGNFINMSYQVTRNDQGVRHCKHEITGIHTFLISF